MSTLTSDEYMDLLAERQTAYLREHPVNPAAPWLKPLLEWFYRDGDEDLCPEAFAAPVRVAQPEPVRKPRVYRSAASLREERDILRRRAAALAEPVLPERAASHGAALGARRTARAQAQQDSRLRRYVALDARIRHLNHRIDIAEARERKP